MIKNVVRYVTLFFCLSSMIACAQTAGQGTSAAPKLDTDDQKTLYALGLLLGRNIKPFALKPDELAIVKAGLSDAVTDAKPQVELTESMIIPQARLRKPIWIRLAASTAVGRRGTKPVCA